jgi:phosphatidylglycerol:prolipoprotein diacylglycerol transferase
MYPTLFRFAWFEVTSYSVMLALSFAAGVVLAAQRAKARGIDPFEIVRLSAYILIAALVGSRLAYALVNYREFTHNLFSIYHNGVFELSGLVMNGGLLLGALTVWAFTAVHRLPLLRILDILAPSVALGMFITRLGCFLNGCCFGRVTSLLWGVIFPAQCPAGHYQRAGLNGLAPIHPAQLYCALGGLAIFLALLAFERKSIRRDGATAFLLFMLYAAARFVVEFFRYNNDHVGQSLGLTHNQYASVFFFLAGASGTLFLRARSREAGSVAATPAA